VCIEKDDEESQSNWQSWALAIFFQVR